MIEVEVAPSVSLGQMPTLRWDASQRHNSILNFMIAYRTAFPESVFTECWVALSGEYERLGVRAADRHEFDERYIKMRFHGIRGARRKRKAFPTTRQEVPLAQATQQLSDEIKTFVASNEPRVKVIEAEAGLGKTYWALHWLGVETQYAQHTNGIFFTDLYVPNHNLSAQIEVDARSHGMTAYTELGRGQQLNGRPVCTKHEAISKVQGIVKETRNRPRVPVLILSATIKRSMVEAVLPVDEWVSIEVEKHPDAKVTQVPINTSKKSLLYGTGDRVEEWDETDKKDKARAEQFRADVARISKGRHLFSYKALIDENMLLAGWFNAVEGLNDWAGGKIDIVGRPLPAPQDVEDMARAIHQDGDPIVPVKQWYPKRPIAMVGGAGMAWCERHTDPRVEDVRWVVCEGAMMQAAARARHVRQGCEIRLFTNMVLPVKVDEVLRFDDLLPDELEYARAPVRVATPKMAQMLFRKFEDMSPNGIKQGLGDLFGWAMDRRAEFIEVRMRGDNHWRRVWIGEGGWRYLCDRLEIVDWREPVRRKDDNAARFDAMQDASRHMQEVRELQEAFEREPWLDEDGTVFAGMVTTAEGWEIDADALVAETQPAVWPWHSAQYR